MNKFLFFFLIPFALSFSKQTIILVHDLRTDPKDPSLFCYVPNWQEKDWVSCENTMFYYLKEILKKKEIEICPMGMREWLSGGAGSRNGVIATVFLNSISPSKKWQMPNVSDQNTILFILEPPSVLPALYNPDFHRCFSKVYTWKDDLVDDLHYFKFYYAYARPMIQNLPSFTQKKLCTFIASNKSSAHPDELYSERLKAVNFFEKNGTNDFTFYGRGWEARRLKTCGGPVQNKIDVLKNFRFSICYENICKIKGYITEKIFDSFTAGCVPVYYGAENVEEFIPKDCFIDKRNFPTYESLYAFLKNMREAEYEGYLERIRSYLSSEKAMLFSQRKFLEIFLRAIGIPYNPETDIPCVSDIHKQPEKSGICINNFFN